MWWYAIYQVSSSVQSRTATRVKSRSEGTWAFVSEHFGWSRSAWCWWQWLRLMDSPASGSCSACLRWREGRRRWGRWAGCWSWEAPFSVQFSERAKNPRAACSVVWSGMNLFSRWLRYYRLLLYFPHNCNWICERELISGSTGGDETKPKNMNVIFIIRVF